MAAIDRMLCQVAEHFSHIGTEEIFMSVSYKKLWKLLIDKDMKKKDCGATRFLRNLDRIFEKK